MILKSTCKKHFCPGLRLILSFIILTTLIPAANSFASSFHGYCYAAEGEKKVKIISFPKDAGLFINGKQIGKTDAEIFLVPGVYKVTLQKESFLTLSAYIEVQERGNEFSFNLTPMLGWMELTVKPDDAKVVINDSVYTDYNVKLLGLSPGKNKMLIERDGYLPEKDSAVLVVGDRVVKLYNMMPAPEFHIRSENNTVELKYMNLVLDFWNLNDLSGTLREDAFRLSIRDDISVPDEYRSFSKTVLGSVRKEAGKISFSLDNKPRITYDEKEIRTVKDYSCTLGPYSLRIGASDIGELPKAHSSSRYSVVLKPRSKAKSLMESALCPGLGQINSKRVLTGVALSAAFAGSVIWNIFSLTDYYSLKSRLNDDITSYLNETNMFQKYKLAQRVDEAYAGIHVKRTKANFTLAVLGTVYVLNILDAVFMTPRVKEAVLEEKIIAGLPSKPGVYYSDTYFFPVININL